MLTIPGIKSSYCDGITRRSCLQIGSLALGGLSLPEILRAESESKSDRKIKGVIMVIMPGGPTHLDMYDLKPAAPVEIRGEFNPIRTKVPGIEICEHLPRMARWMHKAAVIRSVNHSAGCHNCLPSYAGWEVPPKDQRPYPTTIGGFHHFSKKACTSRRTFASHLRMRPRAR